MKRGLGHFRGSKGRRRKRREKNKGWAEGAGMRGRKEEINIKGKKEVALRGVI